MKGLTPVPVAVPRMVIEFVRKARMDVEQFENMSLLNDSQVYSLHRLASEIYAAGWQDGRDVGSAEAREIR